MSAETTTARSETVEQLTAELREVRALLVQLGHETVEATLSAWRARLDNLVVQADLARLDGRDDVRASVDRAEQVWQHTRDRLRSGSEERAEAGEALLVGVGAARSDLAAAVERAEEERAAARR
jgi:hypothetical protein